MNEVDRRLLYFDFITNILADTKFIELDNNSKLVIALLTLKSSLFPEINNFYDEITKDTETEFEFEWWECDRKKFFQIIELVESNSSKFLRILKNLQATLQSSIGRTTFCKKRKDFQDVFEVNEYDMKLIEAIVILKNIPEPRLKLLPLILGVYLERSMGLQRGFPKGNLLAFAGEDKNLNKTVLKKDSPIIQALIKDTSFDSVEISENLYDFLTNKDSDISDLHKCELRNSKVYPIESFKHLDDAKKSLCRTLFNSNRPIAILLQGSPGTGKTEYARSLAESVGKESIFLPTANPADGDKSITNRKCALSVASISLNPSKKILIADEIDDAFHTMRGPSPWSRGEGSKEWGNNLLDKNRAQIIFISNYATFDESTLRRFNLVIHFEEPEKKQKEEILGATFKENEAEHLVTIENLKMLLDHDFLSQGHVALAISDAIASSDDPEIQRNFFQYLIQARIDFFEQKNGKKSTSIKLV